MKPTEREWRVYVQPGYEHVIGSIDQRVYDSDTRALRAVRDALAGQGRRATSLVTQPRDEGDGTLLVFESNAAALLQRACVVIEPCSGDIAKGHALYALLEAELPACRAAGCLRSFERDVTVHDRAALMRVEWQVGTLVWIVYSAGSHLTRDPDILRSFLQDHPEARYYAIDCDAVRLTRLDPPDVPSLPRPPCVKLAID